MRARAADSPLYRIGRRPDPFAWPDWLRAGADWTVGTRWDDPRGAYRVIYAASSLLGAVVEVLARYRRAPLIVAVTRRLGLRAASSAISSLKMKSLGVRKPRIKCVTPGQLVSVR